MQYSADEHFIYLGKTPFHLKQQIKDILNGVWVASKKAYRFPKNVHVYRELYRYFPELEENVGFMRDGTIARNNQIYWVSVKTEIPLNFGLRRYQNEDVNYLKKRGSCLVLNSPRTGKSPTMIKVMAALGTKKNIIICPSSLVYNWVKEFEKWQPDIKVFPVSGTPKKRTEIIQSYLEGTGHRVLIMSKDTWKIEVKNYEAVKFDCAVVDEAHYLRNTKTAQSKAILSLQAKYKYPLTGTPSVKHASDVYGLLHFINPKQFPSYWQFVERYFIIDETMWGKNIGKVKTYREEELKSLMEVNSVQRKREDVMHWLPSVTRQELPVKMEGKQLKLYEQMLDTFMATDEDTDTEVDTMNVLSQLIRLRQLCLEPRLLGFDVVGEKTKALLEFAEDNQEPFIVMTTFSSYFKIIKPELEKLGKKVGVIDGSISQKKKFQTAEEFQSGAYDILLCNIIAAGTGFTLDRADTILFLDKDFTPANNEQAESRIIPTTQARYHPVNVISLVCDDSIDKRINDILDQKLDLTKIVNNPKEILNR